MPNIANPADEGQGNDLPKVDFEALGNPLLERARETARRIEKRVRDTLRDTDHELGKGPGDATEELPPLSGQ